MIQENLAVAEERRTRLRKLMRQAAPSLSQKTHHHQEKEKFLSIVQQLVSIEAKQRRSQQDSVPKAPRRTIYQPLRGDDDDRDEQAFLEKLSPFDFRSEHDDLLDGYSEVRSWFFDSMQYQEWLKGKPWQLTCYGEPRCGKVIFLMCEI